MNNPNASCSAADRDTQPSGGRWLRVSRSPARRFPWHALIGPALICFMAIVVLRLTPVAGDAQGNEMKIGISAPLRNELNAWFVNQQDLFRQSPHVSFRHLFFSADLQGRSARDVAAQVLRDVEREADSPAANLADASMFRHYYEDRTKQEVASVFGTKFTQSLFEQQPGAWRGPVESDSGWHLVWIDSIKPGRVPPFEEVEAAVKAEWLAEQRAAVSRDALEGVRARYQIVLPPFEPSGSRAIVK